MTGARIAGLVSLLVFTGILPVSAQMDKGLRIADGMKVMVEYTITGPEKDVLHTNAGKEPLSFVMGKDKIFPPALDRALLGMKAGGKKHVDLLAEQAFGLYDPKNKITVDRNKIPEQAKVGDVLSSRGGGPPLKIVEMTDKSVVLDGNHPMVGKNLAFDVKVLSVEREDGAEKK